MRADWEKIETDYIVGKMTYAEIAQKYSISPQTVEKQGAKRKWVEKRRNFAGNVQKRARQKTADKKASREAEIYARSITLAEQLVEQMEGALKDDKQLYRHIINQGMGKQAEKTLKKMDTAALKDYANVLIGLGKMMADYSGRMTAKDEQAVKAAKERLRLDKQRAAAETKGAQEVKITIAAPDQPEGEDASGTDGGGAAPAADSVATWEDYSG